MAKYSSKQLSTTKNQITAELESVSLFALNKSNKNEECKK